MPIANLFVNEDVGAAEELKSPDNLYTLLFVDDENGILSALKRVFRNQNYSILTADNANKALEVLRTNDVQLVICDHRMPGMTGTELLKIISEEWPDIIRIMLTGYADVQSIMGAVAEGAVFKFLTKPWLDDDLKVTVARALEQYQLQKEVKKLRVDNQEQDEKIKKILMHLSYDHGTLLRILFRQNIISEEQYDDLKNTQKQNNELTYKLILQYSNISEGTITKIINKSLNIDTINLKECHISPEAAALVPPFFCRDNLILPIRLENDRLLLAMADPTDIYKRDNLETMLGLRINVIHASGSDIENRIADIYGYMDENLRDECLLQSEDDIDIIIEDVDDDLDFNVLMQSSKIPPVVRIVNAIFSEALRHQASDIHIEPRLKDTVIRFRIDGILQERMRIPTHIQLAVTSRIKVLSKMDITQKLLPQDGRISLRASERMIDLRVSTLPTLHGENIVIRLLDRGSTVHYLEDLGLSPHNTEKIKTITRYPQGMLISTGPTGSGKTTLLYALLREHLNFANSYGTIEDPVEYYVEAASQVHIREKTGLTFPVALRSMLRQDPDVILVGEMRDYETAEIAFKAALTGHTVFSTLHTVDAVASITRLLNMGIERYLIASALNCIVAQRLLRTICSKCRTTPIPDPHILSLLKISSKDVPMLQSGKGCKDCGQTGYSGRIGIFEILEMTGPVKELILQNGKELELKFSMIDHGSNFLIDDAMQKVQNGITTLEEVLRVLGPQINSNLKCNQCKTILSPSFAVCPTCGKHIHNICINCGKNLHDQWKFCPVCGQSRISMNNSSNVRAKVISPIN